MIKLVVDVSLSPAWVDVFARHGWLAVHWSTIGDPRAKDRVVMAWARDHAHVVFTHDLDFGTLLALTRANGPSVIQVRAQDVLPEHLEEIVVSTVRMYESQLHAGALVTVDESRGRSTPTADRCSKQLIAAGCDLSTALRGTNVVVFRQDALPSSFPPSPPRSSSEANRQPD